MLSRYYSLAIALMPLAKWIIRNAKEGGLGDFSDEQRLNWLAYRFNILGCSVDASSGRPQFSFDSQAWHSDLRESIDYQMRKDGALFSVRSGDCVLGQRPGVPEENSGQLGASVLDQ